VSRGAGAARAGTGPAVAGSVVILAALRREISALEGRTRIARRWSDGTLKASQGWLQGTDVILASTGDGAENAARGARALLEGRRVESIIVVGVAGALSPALRLGMLLVSREVMDENRPVGAPDPAWLQRALRDTGAIPATFVSSRTILCTPQAKRAAYDALPRGAVAGVDLETAAFARAATERGIPYIALRAISDVAEETLPMDFNAMRDASGAVDVRRVALRALPRPRLLASLWGWRGRMAGCSESLAGAVQALLTGEQP
jgi:adenosylhomocysteine nucleosidase